jgi:predicted RNA polymerase sigma factor
MCLNAARLPARIDASGELRSLFDHDRSAWDQHLIGEGMSFLDVSAKGAEVSEYHIEAAIASVHATARGIEDTDWAKIVSLYDSLLTSRPSPIVALNRAIAIAQRDGPDRGIEEIRTIPDLDRLRSTGPRSESSSFAASDVNRRRAISARLSLWPAMRRSAISLLNAFMPPRTDDDRVPEACWGRIRLRS